MKRALIFCVFVSSCASNPFPPEVVLSMAPSELANVDSRNLCIAYSKEESWDVRREISSRGLVDDAGWERISKKQLQVGADICEPLAMRDRVCHIFLSFGKKNDEGVVEQASLGKCANGAIRFNATNGSITEIMDLHFGKSVVDAAINIGVQ